MSVVLKYQQRERLPDKSGLELIERLKEFPDLVRMSRFVSKLKSPSKMLAFFTEPSQEEIDLVDQGVEALLKEQRRLLWLTLNEEFGS